MRDRFLFVALCFVLGTSHAASPTQTDSSSTPTLTEKNPLPTGPQSLFDDPLKGILVNRTVTVQGHEFYHYFSMWWQHHDAASQYSLSVFERPSARWGSEVWVEHNRVIMFKTFLPPARSQTKKISEQAAAIVFENIENNELEKSLFSSDDLGPEEM